MPREGKASPYSETRDDEASHNNEAHDPYGPWKTYARDELSQEDGHDDTTARAATSCEPDCQSTSPLEPVPQHGYGWAVSGEDLSEWMSTRFGCRLTTMRCRFQIERHEPGKPGRHDLLGLTIPSSVKTPR